MPSESEAMDQPRLQDTPATREYLMRALRMNPEWETGDLLSLRSEVLGTQKKRAGVPEAPRDEIETELAALRRQCWQSEPKRLLTKLDKLSLEGYPDLARAADRLRTVIGSRSQLEVLQSDRRFDADFYSCLQDILAGDPNETAILREQVLSSFSKKHLRKRGRRMVRLLRHSAPDLYALEGRWFDSLMRQRVRLDGSHGFEETESEGTGVPWWVWLLAISFVARILSALFRGG